MDRIAGYIVRNARRILAAALILCVLCALLSLRVPINADMTKYLPGTSPMKQGIDLMAEEFSSLQMPSTVRVMATDPEESRERELAAALERIEHVSAVVRTGEKTLDGHRYVLYTVSTAFPYQSPEELRIEAQISALGEEGYALTVRNDNANGMQIPVLAYALAVTLLLAVLFVMCASWVEPFLFLAVIGMAILLNMGTNILLGSVSQTTYSMAAILQLVLSMDYSIILMNRYRQEKQAAGITGSLPRGAQERGLADEGRRRAMQRAWVAAFPSIASSGFTTLVGLLMLVFMRFKIGRDLGFVLAKGVFLSMVCVLSVLPALILLFDRAVERTAKRMLSIPTEGLARLSYRFRYALTAGAVLLFALTWFLQTRSQTAYSLSAEDPIARIFTPANPIVLLYANEDEAAAARLAVSLEQVPAVEQVLSWGNVLERERAPREMAAYIRELAGGGLAAYLGTGAGQESAFSGEGAMDDPQALPGALGEDSVSALYALYALQNGGNEKGTLSLAEMFSFVSENLDSPLLTVFLRGGMRERIASMAGLLDSAREMLVGPTHSLMMISTTLPVESEETDRFIRDLDERLADEMTGTYYLIGNSPMNVEMKDSFGGELLLITLLTAASIFLVVAVTFRQLWIPAILVALVQCGVFMTITTTWLLGYRIYYLAIIIVQCILMGATVDYGILLTNYYRELRRSLNQREAMRQTYEKSVHTILTSALFMISVTGALGFSPVDPTIGQICQSISLGALSATLLVLFVLPGILSALDRFVSFQTGN